MALVALIPVEFSTESEVGVGLKFFDCFNLIKKEGNRAWYGIKKDLLISEYKSFLVEFYGAFGELFYNKLDLTEVPQVNTYEKFYEAFYQKEGFNEPCLVKFREDSGLYPWSNTEPRINLEEAWIFYWPMGKISCESMVGGDILGMLELSLVKNLSNPLAPAMRFVFISG